MNRVTDNSLSYVLSFPATTARTSMVSAIAADPVAGVREWLCLAPADFADRVSVGSNTGWTNVASAAGLLDCVQDAIQV